MIRVSASSLRVLGASVVAALATFAGAPRDAEACGGVFVQQIDSPASRQIVRDHRMAIAIGRDKTVVWDEVRLQGDPRDFVWITPVKPGTKVEIADEPWMQALDVSTQPVVYAPRNDSSGCALAGCAADEDTSGNPPAGSVTIVNEEVIGPYDSVTVRAAGDADAPYRWLTSNGYRLDDDKVRGVLASYADQGFDFAALKLHATCNQTAMKPVRIVIPGTEPRILVRMALAGAQLDVVPITLFVIAEAPYHPGNYPFGFVDDDQLEWNHKGSTRSANSNYDELADAVMARDARTWLVESVTKADLTSSTISGASYGTTRLPTPGLYEAYEALCAGNTPRNADTRNSSNSSSSSAISTTLSMHDASVFSSL